MLDIKFTGDGISRLEKLSRELGDGTAKRVYSKAINDTGKVAATATGRALSKQTALPMRTGARAMKKQTRSTSASLAFVIDVKGGNIQTRFFKPRETGRGVSAAPRGDRQVFVGSFMKAGWWPKRVKKANWSGRVLFKSGAFVEDAKTDVIIPEEVMKDQTAQAFDQSKVRLDDRVTHYLTRLAGGALT